MFRKEPLSTAEFINSNPRCEQLVQCIYGLNYLEFETFCSLQLLRVSDINGLMEHMDRSDRTKINRALNKLIDIGLVTREKVSVDGKSGYKYIYHPRSLIEVKAELKEKVDNWYQEVVKEIDNLVLHFVEKVQMQNKTENKAKVPL